MKLTKLESDFIKLQWVNNRMRGIYNKFQDIPGNDEMTKLFKAVLRETILLQTHNFIIIRKSLIKDPNVKKVDKCLEPLWKPILDYETPIKLYRNNYIAHVQQKSNPFKMMPEQIIDTYQMPAFYAEWLLRAACIIFYCQQLEANFKDVWDSAEKKYRANMPLSLSYGTLRLNTFKKQAGINLITTLKNLKNANLAYHVPKKYKDKI